jgi:lauroyl/myristoyl acyltransferase
MLKPIGLWIFWFPFRRIVQAIPRKISYAIAHVGGLVIYCMARNLRRITCEETARCLGISSDTPMVRMAVRQCFVMDVKRRFEDLMLGALTKRDLDEMVHIAGAEHIDAALMKGKGVIVLLSHFGSFLMILPALGFKGYRISQLGGPPLTERRGYIHQVLFEARKKAYSILPVQFLRSDSALRDVLLALKRNEIVAIAFDGRIGDKWVETDFCGNRVHIAPGPVKLALKTGAAILPTFIVRNSDNTHRLIVEKAVSVEVLDTREATIQVNIQKISNIFGRYVAAYPAHFGMILTIIRRRIDKGIIEIPFFADHA